MSRLLFAAARGARIQINGFTATVPSWYDSHKWSSMHESVLRIHPDDEHLQYGPISTAVREFAASLPIEDKTARGLPIFLVPHTLTWYNLARNGFDSKAHRVTFLLLLAEALADEGL